MVLSFVWPLEPPLTHIPNHSEKGCRTAFLATITPVQSSTQTLCTTYKSKHSTVLLRSPPVSLPFAQTPLVSFSPFLLLCLSFSFSSQPATLSHRFGITPLPPSKSRPFESARNCSQRTHSVSLLRILAAARLRSETAPFTFRWF